MRIVRVRFKPRFVQELEFLGDGAAMQIWHLFLEGVAAPPVQQPFCLGPLISGSLRAELPVPSATRH